MSVYDREIKVNGDAREVYVGLVKILNRHGYTLCSQDPPHRVAVKRGSETKAALLSVADYEELEVTLSLAKELPYSLSIHFHFDFPTWTDLVARHLSEEGRIAQVNRKLNLGSISPVYNFMIKEKLIGSDILVDDFAQFFGGDRVTASTKAGGSYEPSDHISVHDLWGGEVPQSQPASNNQSANRCPSCLAESVATARYCKQCGIRFKDSD